MKPQSGIEVLFVLGDKRMKKRIPQAGFPLVYCSKQKISSL
jgi:hypothetical protein